MKVTHAIAIALVVTAGAAAAQGAQRWTATSTTASGITGNITLSPTALVAAGQTFPLTKAATLPKYAANGATQPATVYKVTRPSNPKLLRGNQLCSAPVTWVVTYMTANNQQLNLDVYSGAAQPTANSSNTSTSLCSSLMYSH